MMLANQPMLSIYDFLGKDLEARDIFNKHKMNKFNYSIKKLKEQHRYGMTHMKKELMSQINKQRQQVVMEKPAISIKDTNLEPEGKESEKISM